MEKEEQGEVERLHEGVSEEKGVIYLNWVNINVDKSTQNLPDKMLLESVKECRIFTGWGLLAELCKRFDRLT